MWLKLIGSSLIIIFGTSIGFNLAKKVYERPRQLRQIISCLTALKSFINYGALPLDEALIKCSRGVTGPVKDFFEYLRGSFLNERWLRPEHLTANVLQQLRNKLFLNDEEMEALVLLSAGLGQSNRSDQEKHLNLYIEQFISFEKQALSVRDNEVKMYRYLGICGSLAVVIILI